MSTVRSKSVLNLDSTADSNAVEERGNLFTYRPADVLARMRTSWIANFGNCQHVLNWSESMVQAGWKMDVDVNLYSTSFQEASIWQVKSYGVGQSTINKLPNGSCTG